jgi:hypothetical protein
MEETQMLYWKILKQTPVAPPPAASLIPLQQDRIQEGVFKRSGIEPHIQRPPNPP